MGKRSKRERTRDSKRYCGGKVIYSCLKRASSAAGQVRAKKGESNILPYPCKQGSHFHIGHNRPIAERKVSPTVKREHRERSPEEKLSRYTNHLGHIAAELWEAAEDNNVYIPETI